MPWLVDELAGAALGPWGLAVVAGIGVGALVSKRYGPSLAGAATGAASGVAAGATASRAQVRDRVSSGLSGVRSWWQDVYDEAYTEWQQSRAGTAAVVGTVKAASVPTVAPHAAVTVPKVVRTGGPRVRGANGRYVKSESA
jgi:hypothetical protein